jgi:WD40 repeat protein
MKKHFLQTLLACLLILAAVTACQAGTAPTAAPGEQATPKIQKPVITSQNAGQLKAAHQAASGSAFNDVVWAADGSALLAISGSGAARFSTESLEKQETFTYDTPAAFYAASPDGKTVAFSDADNNIFLADIQVTENAKTFTAPFYIGRLDFSPDGKTLLSTSMDEIAITLWDAASGKQLQTITGFETAAPVYSAKFGADGKRIIWFARGTVQLYDLASQKFGPVMSHEDFVSDETLSQDGSLVATAAAGTVNGEFTPAIFLWDAASGELKNTLTNSDGLNAIAFSPDGSLIAASTGSKLLFWDVANGKKTAEISAGSEEILGLAFSPDGTSLAASGVNGTVTLWQVQ